VAFELYLFRFVDGEVEPLAVDPLLSVLERHGLAEAFDAGYVELSDGLGVEVAASDFRSGEATEIGVIVRGVSPPLYELLFDLMAAGGLTALVVDEPAIPLVLSLEAAAELPEGLGDPVVCPTPQDVGVAIEEPFARWASSSGFA
jgi:hypothetical protein